MERDRISIMMLCGAMMMMMMMIFVQPTLSYSQIQPVHVCTSVIQDPTMSVGVDGVGSTVMEGVHVRDRLDCLKKMENGEADFGYFEAEDIAIAANSFTGQFEAVVQVETGNEIKETFLLVNNASNLNPKSLCHPGFNYQYYYPISFQRPTISPSIRPPQDIKTHIRELSRVWESACIPGPWTHDPVTDRLLKRQYPQLCSRCLRQSCDIDDGYVGSAGALQCLLDHAADAAIVSDIHLDNAKATNSEVSKLFHYCGEIGDGGSILPLPQSEAEPACNWGMRPLPVFLARRCDGSEREDCILWRNNWIDIIFREEYSYKDSLLINMDLDHNTALTKIDRPVTPAHIIQQATKPSTTQPQSNPNASPATPIKPVRFCVHSEEEREKCLDLKKALSGYGNVGVGLDCELMYNDTDCFVKLYFGEADIVTLDAGDIYTVTKDYGFKGIVNEVYGTSESGGVSASYYAVAVVRADSNITAFSHLKGRKSCHTGIGKTAGWKLPVATLLQLGLINPQHCNYVKAMAEFFSGGSCAPGAKIPHFNKQNNYVTRLCSLCVGAEDNNCARDNSETFYGYSGAFRCLVHGGADVAFVKHTTVIRNTDGFNLEEWSEWSANLRSDDYRLLCPSQSGPGTAPISQYKNCNLALVPAHEVVVAGSTTDIRQQQIREVLLAIAEIFKPASHGSKTFKLFGSYKGKNDLLFKDSAVGLRSLTEDTKAEKDLKQQYYNKMDELHSCEVRVCALEGEEEHCNNMADTMREMGHQFVCVSARDRLDCIRRLNRGQVDMAPLPGNYLGVDRNLRIIAYSRDPYYSEEYFRYRAVMVVRRSTVGSIRDLRGKKSCHTGYGKTSGWRIPLAMLKRQGLIQPLCDRYQSAVEHEIASISTTFNRACIPGEWASTSDTDFALKNRFKAMCSLCSSGTCDKSDAFAGYEGTLRCLTIKNADIAFTKLSVVKDFFADNRGVNVSEFGLLCRDGSIVDINSGDADNCFWAARPWNTFVTHGSASDAKVQKLLWALTQSKWKGEEDLEHRQWYYKTLGIHESFTDILPDLDNKTTGIYYEESRMSLVNATKLCSNIQEPPVRLCVTSDQEYAKCLQLREMLRVRGVVPMMLCVKEADKTQCIDAITSTPPKADVVKLNDNLRFRTLTEYNLSDLLVETYASSETNRYYLVAVIRKNSNISNIYDLVGKTTCNPPQSAEINSNETINSELSNCLGMSSNFFTTYKQAFNCLQTNSNKNVAFVKHHIQTDGGLHELNEQNLNLRNSNLQNSNALDSNSQNSNSQNSNSQDLNLHNLNSENLNSEIFDASNFELVCDERRMEVTDFNVRECNLGRVPGDVVVTRQTDSDGRKEDMRHVLLKSSQLFGKDNSFFKLFYDYYGQSDLLFSDNAIKLIPVSERHHFEHVESEISKPCDLYIHHNILKQNTT